MKNKLRTNLTVEAFCAEMNCDWQGSVPVVARCPRCASRQLRFARIVYVEHPEFGTVPTVGGRVCADFITEAKGMGIVVPKVLA